MRWRWEWMLLAASGCGREPLPPAPPAPLATPSVAPPSPPPTNIAITLVGPGEPEIEGTGELATSVAITLDHDPEPTQLLEPTEPFRLVESCETKAAGACVRLDHPLRPIPWSGMSCGTQCTHACRANVSYGPGMVHFTVTSCDGLQTFRSPGSYVPNGRDAVYVERRWAAESMVSATATLLEDDLMPRGATQTLDENQRAKLATLLEDFDGKVGYDDAVRQGCKMHGIVGFGIHRTLPTTSTAVKTQDLDVTMDVKCRTLVITRGDRRVVHSTHFGPRSVSFLRSLFPGLAK